LEVEVSARALVRSSGGDWCGSYGLVAGPGHSPRDRSLKVWEAGGQVYVHSFSGDDWKACRAHLGLDDDWCPTPASPRWSPPPAAIANPTRRIRGLLRTAAPVDLVPDVVLYLKSRKLWPLPHGCTLKAHAGAPYYSNGDLVGRFPALLAEVFDIKGELTTLHVTYLKNNRKLTDHPPRKLLSSTNGRIGCAVRLVPAGPVLGIAEGIETALAAMQILDVPVWAALNTALLGKFEPPAGVERQIIAADRDVAGLTAAWKLRDLATLPMELKLPQGADFAEDLS
jgi:hypothetical protein